ncbi:MAG: nitroreductase [Alphaproteobacteria bacterium]|nr:nitroreductase family protein [Rhodobiaceae bacterium]MBO6541735.1 nitroreductase [Alphaproteobacteria bacterium]MBO6628870.1 nitroreductase [Alphaproteobacteria bacterium]MDF1625929.1 nitroreductase [Parvibaculaceae bacterium]
MNVSEALDTRITCRAYQDKPVSAEKINRILTKAARTASGGNLQPWHVWAIGGEKMAAFRKVIQTKFPENPFGDGATEYDIYPKELTDPYKARRFKCGEDMYASINVPREDKAGRQAQFARNFDFFGAPAALFFAIDRQMGLGQWSDLGMYIQSIMLMAREEGLHTSAQEAWALWYKTIGEFLEIPDNLMFFCGMGIGYMDETAPINTLRTDRAPFPEYVHVEGF